MVFPAPVGRQRVAAMGLDEMRAVAGALPGLGETGFYVGGFPGVVNYGVIPLVYAGMKVAPKWAARPLGHLLDAGLRRFSRPPYATFLQPDGGEVDQPVGPLMRLRHDDAYLLTAAPVVAAIRQVLADPRPGVHLQAMLVEPKQFFADLAAMGVEVWPSPRRPSPVGRVPLVMTVDQVLEWLLAGDPAVRRQVQRDLTGEDWRATRAPGGAGGLGRAVAEPPA